MNYRKNHGRTACSNIFLRNSTWLLSMIFLKQLTITIHYHEVCASALTRVFLVSGSPDKYSIEFLTYRTKRSIRSLRIGIARRKQIHPVLNYPVKHDDRKLFALNEPDRYIRESFRTFGSVRTRFES